jgi:hypothetical protein
MVTGIFIYDIANFKNQNVMKSFFSFRYYILFTFALLFGGIINVFGANRYSVANGNWSSTAVWSASSGGASGASVPVAGDVVYIEGNWTVTVAATAACTTLNIASGSTLSIGAYAITVSGATSVSGNLTITSVTGTKIFTGLVTINSGGIWTNTNSAVTFRGGITNNGTFNAGTGVHTFDTSSQQLNGTLSIPNVTVTGVTLTNNNTLTVGTALSGTGGLTQAANSTLNIGGTSGITTLTATASGNKVNYNLTGAQTAKVTTYYNLTLSGSATKTFTTAPTVNGILSMEGTATISIAPTYGTSATLQYNTTTARTAGVEWVSPFAASGGIIIANTGAISMNSAEVFNSTAPLTINSGATLAMGTYLLTLNGNFINNGGTTSGSGGVTITGTATQSIGSFTNTGTVSMTKTGGTATLTGTISGGALTINGTGGTLNLGASLSHTFSGAVTLTSGTLNGGSSTIITAGNWTNNGGTFTPSSGTVSFTGNTMAINGTAAAQSFYNMIVNKTAGQTLSVGGSTTTLNVGGTFTETTGNFTAPATMSVTGALTLTAGTFTAGTNITASGNWTNNGGTFTSGSGTITFNGCGAQTIGCTTSNTFNNLTINNTSGVLLSNNTTVNGILTFSNGIITTGANSIILGNSATVSGAGAGMYVYGNLTKGIAAATTTKTFEIGDATSYTPVTLNFTGSTNGTGSITAKTTAGDHPSIGTSIINPSLSLNRYWTLVNTGVSGFTSYDATFIFVPGDIDTGADYSSFIAGKYSSSLWSYPALGTTSSTSAQATGLIAFGDFQFGESSVLPTACQYSDNGSTPTVSDVMPCINMPSNPQTVSTTFAAHQYFTMNVIKGLTYEIYTCNTTSPANQLMVSVYKEGASSDPAIAFSYSNTGNPCTNVANNVYTSFTPAFSGQVRALINRKGSCSSSLPSGLTVMINVKTGSNTQDDQSAAGTDTWTGHIYDGTNTGISFN